MLLFEPGDDLLRESEDIWTTYQFTITQILIFGPLNQGRRLAWPLWALATDNSTTEKSY